jgi:small subunit ribosomal protein S18
VVIATPPPAAPAAGPRSGPRRRPGEFGGGGRKFTPRRKVCAFCVDKIKEVDYKDLGRLRRFLSERGKIEPRRKTGTCAAHQRSLNVALKRARQLAMLPFTAEHIRVTGVLVREPGAPPFRGPRGPRPMDGEAGEPEAAPAADGVAAAEGAQAAPAAGAEAPGAEAPAAEAATEGSPPPSPESPQTVAESSAAQVTSDTPATGPTTPE